MTQTKWSDIGKIFLPVILFPMVIFIIFHCTPSMAVRSYIFSSGHPIEALKADVKKEANYYATNTKIDGHSGSDYIGNFNVKKKAFFYIAKTRGNG